MIDLGLKIYIFVTQSLATGLIVTNFFTNAFDATLYTYIRLILLSSASFFFYLQPNRTDFLGKGSASTKENATISKIVSCIAATVNVIIVAAFYFNF
jgi:hypothetical protein